MDDTFRHLGMPAELACQFLAVFSRTEYALKSTGYALGGEHRVDPDWDRFANDIDGQFTGVDVADVLEARQYILDNPPRKQVILEGRIAFREQTIDHNQRTTQQLLLMIRTVRNNLFHGGKYAPDGEFESGRNQRLVQYSLIILLTCLHLAPEVGNSFKR